MDRILVVEDDTILSTGLCYNLRKAGYDPVPVQTIEDAGYAYSEKEYALVLLDINLPDGNGLDFARRLRLRGNVPVLILTARTMDREIMEGFDAGADDYITKPFNMQILIRRVRAVLRRHEIQSGSGNGSEKRTLTFSDLILCGNLEINTECYTVKKGESNLKLTPTEIKLLFKLCQNPGRVLTRNVLLGEIWDTQEKYVDEHALTVQMSRLKQKLADSEYTYIKTVYGMGYQWIGEKED